MDTQTPSYFLKVSPLRFAVFQISSFGLYAFFWLYKNWDWINKEEGMKVSPFWRATFNILFFESLAIHIKKIVERKAVKVSYVPRILMVLYVALFLSSLLQYPYSLLGLFLFVPYLPIVHTLYLYHSKEYPLLKVKKVTVEVALLVIGGMTLSIFMFNYSL